MKAKFEPSSVFWFNEETVFEKSLGFNINWVFKSPNNYSSKMFVDIFKNDEDRLKSDCIAGSIVNGNKQPILSSFDLQKPSCFEIFQYLKQNFPTKKTVFNIITLFYTMRIMVRSILMAKLCLLFK